MLLLAHPSARTPWWLHLFIRTNHLPLTILLQYGLWTLSWSNTYHASTLPPTISLRQPSLSREIDWFLPKALARGPDCPRRLLYWLCIVVMLSTVPCIFLPWEGFWLYRPLGYSLCAMQPLSYLPRLYSYYIVAIYRHHWPSIWCGHSLLGY